MGRLSLLYPTDMEIIDADILVGLVVREHAQMLNGMAILKKVAIKEEK